MKGKRLFLKRSILFVSALSFILFSSHSFGATINVPGDQSTIQAGIDAASVGDTVLVADGTYKGAGNKDLDFKGKAITVQSENGPNNCIIDCEEEGRGFYFHSGEGAGSVVSGITITKGMITGSAGVESRPARGGGIYCSSSSPTITNCIISYNTVQYGSSSSGAGIYCSSSSPTITNCMITGNTVSSTGSRFSAKGGGIAALSSSSPTITNCTICNNTADHYSFAYGGGIYCDSSSSSIINCILWDNTPDEIYGDSNATYSDIKGGYAGLGNINSNPLFVASGVYELSASSPCIDAGTANGAPSTDIDGNSRPQSLGYDMGAYEYFRASFVPTATTGSATNITLNSATLNGTLNPNGASAWYYFEYGTTTNYGSTTESSTAGAGMSSVPVSADIADELELSTTYHYRLVGANSAGTNYGSDQTFVTSPSEPSVSTDAATSVTISSATLNGDVNPNGASTTYYFEYGTTTSYGLATTVKEAGSGTSAVSVNAGISGLELNTTYHFRVVATNNLGTANGDDQTFTTNTLVPSVSTGSATSVTSNSATLNGTINPNGANTTYYFEYGITSAYGSVTTTTSAGSGTSAVSVNANMAGLSENTTYYFRLVATNSIGTTSGSNQTFTTSTLTPESPTVKTGPALLITSYSGILTGDVNPNASSTEAYFEYGTTTGYGFSTPPEDVGTGTSSISVKATISNLTLQTTYHYRLIATNILGVSTGSDVTFYTAIIYVSSDGICGGKSPCYSTILEAINAASSGAAIRVAAGDYDEDLTLDTDTVIILQGGWDSSFTAQVSTTIINGSLVVNNGELKTQSIMVHFQK
jgi:hypothetical protein